MEIMINGEPKTISEETSVLSLLESLAGANDTGGIAVALDGAVVPKSLWGGTLLRPGMKIEIVHAVAGG